MYFFLEVYMMVVTDHTFILCTLKIIIYVLYMHAHEFCSAVASHPDQARV